MLSPLLARFRAHATQPYTAVVDTTGKHTYASLLAGAGRVAAALLRGRASLSSARVALQVSPGGDFVEALFGVWLAGGTVVVLSPLHPPPETAYFCADAEVETVLFSPLLEDLIRHVPTARLALPDAQAFAPAAALPDIRAESPALQLYTSGTTGKPKGAVILHQNLAVQQEMLREAWGFSPDDVLLHTLPLHHMHGLAIALLTALGAGATSRMLPTFDARVAWDAMGECTVLMAVPTIYAKLLAAYDGADERTRARWAENARRLRLATSGSAALPVTVAGRWRAIAGAFPLERFGMTEIGVGTSNPLVGERRAGSVGLPLPSVKTRVVGDNGADADSGELWIAGPSVFSSYFRREDATRDAFAVLGGERWFKTGDTVTRDADGYFRILGRTSVDILKSGGYKLSALEIEEALLEHDAVAEVAVVGLPDETWGDRVVACVVAREGRGAECTEELLRAFVRERLAPYKVPKTVAIMRELPRNAVGKVVKPELVKRLLAATITG